ncbi:putative rip defective [Diaporthe ampelina]|uniref:DNA (cytosine-5-)-methyltransferase n=1 Tax=Diaporthe ampelina TaxID=1214573 RepID=A0A0G2FHC9_9PEZI|nr:putative rip defective [Diaporthe ampelina]
MFSIRGQHSVKRAGSLSKRDPFINFSEQLDGIALIDLTADDKLDNDYLHKALSDIDKPPRDYALDPGHQSVKKATISGNHYVEIGQFVELREHVGPHKIEFIEVQSIYVHMETGEVVIRGLPYARARNLHGCLPRKQNEVCLIIEVDVKDAPADEEQALVELGPEDILKKRILTNTNKPFPLCRFDPVAYNTDEQKEKEAPLSCRWKMRAEYKDASQRRAGRFQGQILEHFSEHDGHKIKKRNLGVDQERSRQWRGETIPGGSTFLEPNFIEDEIEDSKPVRVQRYSFAEVAAGAGGASRGAEMAGFKVVLATESCPHAGHSFRANFPNAELHAMKPAEFATDGSQQAVDILHISSSALNSAGDDPNAAEEMCNGLLRKTVTRFVSMEQPVVILSERKAPFLNAILRSFTTAGFSFQWKIVQMADYGLPQMRKRFLLLGAGPGETLPTWPAVTHSADPTGDQQPFVTEEEATGGLNSDLHSLHDPESLRAISRAPRDANKPLNTAINASGSVYHHPDGERGFTLRELACLQGFPAYHQFEGSHIKKQIANACPPSVAMAFYQHLRQHIEKVDGVHSGTSELGEPAVAPSASFPEFNTGNESTVGSVLYDETPSCTPDEVMSHATETARSMEEPPHTQPTSPASQTPSPAQYLPTPSISGRSIAGQREAAFRLKRKRERIAFEEPESDDDEDGNDGPLALQTPSKRPRVSLSTELTRASSSESSRTVSSTSANAARHVEDEPMPEDAVELGGIGPDHEMLAYLAGEI